MLQSVNQISFEVKTLTEPAVHSISKGYLNRVQDVMKADGMVTGYKVEIKTEGKNLELASVALRSIGGVNNFV